jgi:hypothetical protein
MDEVGLFTVENGKIVKEEFLLPDVSALPFGPGP